MKPRILVTEPLLDPVLSFLRAYFELTVAERGSSNSVPELISQLKGFQGVLSMLSNPFTEEVFEAVPELKIIANHAVGYNNIDVDAAKKHQVIVTNTPDVLTEATADHTMALILSLTRKVVSSDSFLRQGEFDGWNPTGFLGVELNGTSLGIIGMGRIGQAVAKRALSFGMRIHYHQPTQKTNLPFKATYHASLEEMLRVTRMVSIHCPLSSDTYHLLSSDQLSCMQKGSYLINTARGPIVEEKVLADYLHSGHLAGAGLDVFEEEPIVHPELLNAPNTILTPHIASATYQTRVAMGMLAAHSLKQVFIDEDIEGLAHRVV